MLLGDSRMIFTICCCCSRGLYNTAHLQRKSIITSVPGTAREAARRFPNEFTIWCCYSRGLYKKNRPPQMFVELYSIPPTWMLLWVPMLCASYLFVYLFFFFFFLFFWRGLYYIPPTNKICYFTKYKYSSPVFRLTTWGLQVSTAHPVCRLL